MKPRNEVFQLEGRELSGDAYDDNVAVMTCGNTINIDSESEKASPFVVTATAMVRV
jgi:hypothetical protein